MVLEESLKNIVDGRSTFDDEILKRVGEKRTSIVSIVESSNNMVGYLIRHSNWFTTLIEGSRERKAQARGTCVGQKKEEGSLCGDQKAVHRKAEITNRLNSGLRRRREVLILY